MHFKILAKLLQRLVWYSGLRNRKKPENEVKNNQNIEKKRKAGTDYEEDEQYKNY